MLLSLHGQSKDALTKTQAGSWEYDIVEPNYKCNMTDIMAAIGVSQLERYSDMLAHRKKIIKRYDTVCETLPVKILNHLTKESVSSGHLYLVRINEYDSKQRNILIRKMAEHGIATNVHYKPLPMLTAYQNMGFKIDDYPNSYYQYQNEISLPLHSSLTAEQVEYVIKTFKILV